MIIRMHRICDFVMGSRHIDDILVLYWTRPGRPHDLRCHQRHHADIGGLSPIGHLFVQIGVSFGGTITLRTIFDHPRQIKRHFQ